MSCSVFVLTEVHISVRNPDEDDFEDSLKGSRDLAEASQITSMDVSLQKYCCLSLLRVPVETTPSSSVTC